MVKNFEYISCLFVSTEYTNLTESQTDGQTDRYRTTAQAALMQNIARQKMNENSACVCVRLSDGESLVETSQNLRQRRRYYRAVVLTSI